MKPEYSDLKLIDELLCDMKGMHTGTSWEDIEEFSSVTRRAMRRLREAYSSGEMTVITLGLANYFRGKSKST